MNKRYQELIQIVPDFPEKGILFRDITPLLNDASAFQQAIDDMSNPFYNKQVDAVVAIEARGYILGAPIALELRAKFVPVRKEGKLPRRTTKVEYSLEYGTATIEVHQDALHSHQRVLIVDDVLATGGTLEATMDLVEQSGAETVGIVVLAELLELKGRQRINREDVVSLLKF